MNFHSMKKLLKRADLAGWYKNQQGMRWEVLDCTIESKVKRHGFEQGTAAELPGRVEPHGTD